MKSFLCFFLFMLFAYTIQAQDNYKSGYIITNDNDTITGWSDYRTDAKNALICQFKLFEKSGGISYKPGQIYGYRFSEEGKFYVTRTIELDGKSRTVFLEYMIQGIINLYYFVDSSSSYGKEEYYFFEDETGKMTPISKKDNKFITTEDGSMRIKEDMKYKGILRYLMKDSETVVKEVDNMNFNQESMIKVAKDYHDQVCKTGEECVIFESTPDKHYTTFRYSLYGGTLYYMPGEEFGNCFCPLIGFQVNMTVPRLNKYLSFQLDLAFSRFKYTVENYWQGDYYTHFHRDIESFLIPFKAGARYTIGNKKLRPSIEAGAEIDLMLGYKEYWYASQRQTREYSNIYNCYIGFYAAIGLEYKLKKTFHSIFVNLGANTNPEFQGIYAKAGYTF